MVSDDHSEDYHVPVLLHEAVDGLNIQPNGVYVDCTFGGGGHSAEILKRLGKAGKLIAFDQDEDAAKNLPVDGRLLFIPHNFRHLRRFLKLHGYAQVDGILADLGVSSFQFNEASRGFSTRFDAALDMRMDRRQTVTAASLLNTLPKEALHKLFEKYGEVTNARTLAAHIVARREVQQFSTISKAKQVLAEMVKGNPNKYFAQVFQALRIVVNQEMESLEEMLPQAQQVLNVGGRLSVISFHSVEDRIVKQFLKAGNLVASEEDDLFGRKPEAMFELITKKPVTASAQELKINNRSRSAKLRVAQKK